jgi:hypothetical protein
MLNPSSGPNKIETLKREACTRLPKRYQHYPHIYTALRSKSRIDSNNNECRNKNILMSKFIVERIYLQLHHYLNMSYRQGLRPPL